MLLKRVITLTPVGEKEYYVYILSFPEGVFTLTGEDLSGIVFYVGRGTWKSYVTTGIQRIDTHEHEAIRYGATSDLFNPRLEALAVANWYKFDAIRHIWISGKSVVKRVTFETFDLQEVKEVERQTIKLYRNPYLTNRENFAQCKTRDWLTPLPTKQDQRLWPIE